MQDTDPLPWGALDRFQAHFVVRVRVDDDRDVTARTVLETAGHFGAKRVRGVSWSGGRLADELDRDAELNGMIARQSVDDASIFIEPTGRGVRMHGKWKNHMEFGVSKEMFDIYDRIARHVRGLGAPPV